MTTFELPGFTIELDAPPFSLADATLLETAEIKMKAKFQSKEIGFYDLPSQLSKEALSKMHLLCTEWRRKYQGVVLIGIGGSYLGPAALLDALRSISDENSFPFHWISNTDATAIKRAEAFLSGKKAAVIVISKSGNTTETLSAFFHLSRHFEKEAIAVITDPKSGELRRLSIEQGWHSFEVPPNIGGRFSVFSSVGLLPLLLGGVDIMSLLSGAQETRTFFESVEPPENPSYFFAHALRYWDQKEKRNIQYLMPYQSGLKMVADWFVQLFGESLGKNGKGFTPVTALGTTDQHSLLQLFKEGPKDKVVGFLIQKKNVSLSDPINTPSFKSDSFSYLFKHSFEEITRLAALATEKSLVDSPTKSYRITLNDISAKSLGSLLFFFETACAFAGELYGIDAFNQPGVEQSKQLLRQSL